MDQLFKSQVYEIAKLVPKGRVTTYGSIAKAIGYPNHSRQVGKVMGDCGSDVPAHRIVGSCGILSVVDFKPKLEAEGLEFNNLKLKNFKTIFWDPNNEIQF